MFSYRGHNACFAFFLCSRMSVSFFFFFFCCCIARYAPYKKQTSYSCSIKNLVR